MKKNEIENIVNEIYDVTSKNQVERKSHYIALGNKIIEDEFRKNWERCVDIRLKDIFGGIELGYALETILILNCDDSTLDDACKTIDKHNTSGCCFTMSMCIIEDFARRGKDFREYYEK